MNRRLLLLPLLAHPFGTAYGVATADGAPSVGVGSAKAVEAQAVEIEAVEAERVATPRRFDPGAMPEPTAVPPALGYRYGQLSPAEVAVLRRSFKLPLDAIATAKSSSDLSNRARVSPLPDPNRPLLSVEPATRGDSDPFGGAPTVSFRDDPLRALGAMLDAVEGEKSRSGKPREASKPDESEDPFGEAPIGDAASTPSPTAPAEVTEDSDPFADDADPFADDPEKDEAQDAAPASDSATDAEDPFSF